MSRVLRSRRSLMVYVFPWSLLLVIALSEVAAAQNGSWTTETVDKLSSRGVSLAVDKEGNLHVSYVTDQGDVKYAFRSASSPRWFTMNIAKGIPYYGHGGGMFTRIEADAAGNPHFCFTAPPSYAYYLSGSWHLNSPQSPGGAYACGIAVGPDGTTHMSWYQEKDGEADYYLHPKYAVLRDNQWLLKTIDLDRATGKWNQLVLDGKGLPHLSYSAFNSGQMKYASFDGSEWKLQVVDSGGVGFGNALALDKNGRAHMSYFSDRELKYAREESSGWTIQVVDLIAPRGGAFEDFRSSVALDSQGRPHISYEDAGAVKYAAYNGTSWIKQTLTPVGSEPTLATTIAIGPDDSVYVAYRDPLSGAVTVAKLPHRASEGAIPNRSPSGTGKQSKRKMQHPLL